MAEPLWQKDGTTVDARIMRFLAGDDIVLDRELMPYDLRASAVHAQGLAAIGILSNDELRDIERQLGALGEAFASGAFVLDDAHEDCHSAIESWLTAKLGDTGRRIHTGRSRNDQVLVATRLYLKDRLAELKRSVVACADACIERARADADVVMPGYTHLQRAVVSSAAMWWAGFAEAFIDDAQVARDALSLVDANPLGTAAGYGVNLELPRERTTEALGFARTQVSPVNAQLSRGKFEWHALAALAHALGDVRRLAWDLSLFTTSEFGFVSLPDAYTTGSSIMPNKRNPDVVELLRASYAVVAGAMAELQSLTSLPSGYQRDLQYSKGPTLRAMRHGLDALSLVPTLVRELRWNESRLRDAIEPAMYATDVAIERARDGIPFRDAYREATRDPSLAQRTPERSLAERVSFGAGQGLGLAELIARLGLLRGVQGQAAD